MACLWQGRETVKIRTVFWGRIFCFFLVFPFVEFNLIMVIILSIEMLH